MAAQTEQGTMANNSKKTVLITGCSSGIGLKIAIQLAKDPEQRYHGEKSWATVEELLRNCMEWDRLDGVIGIPRSNTSYRRRQQKAVGLFCTTAKCCVRCGNP